MADSVRIEQRLQDIPRFFMWTIDECVVLSLPLLVGMLSRHLILGVVGAVLAWRLWNHLKGDGGVERLLALVYWHVPVPLSPYRSLPDASVLLWRG